LVWCVPWGIAAPFVAVANLYKSFREPVRSELESVLALVGMNLADLEVGSDGLSKAERDRLAAVAKILGRRRSPTCAESLEWATAVEVLVAMSSKRLSLGQIDHWMRVLADEQTHSGASARERLIHDFEDRLMVLRIAVEVALADGQLSPEEFLALAQVASALNLSDHDLAAILAVLTDSSADGQSTSGLHPEVAHAFRVLGLDPDASTAEIRDAYKSRMLQHHPDLAPEEKQQEATTRSAEINDARGVLLGVRNWSGPK
jgi:DnaJ-domain-containing protein 1